MGGGHHLFVSRPHHFVTRCNRYCRYGKQKVTCAPAQQSQNSERGVEVVSLPKCKKKKKEKKMVD